ncbi:DUF2946 domain-containing protein [Caballeronia sp. SEWSISQ10-4 2]|uniref:DUF2946 domain-containing protein n=1 Tax=Caballeronia sp. SEWSISQ10-4 2 TaxID=2937438 RepID=UPI002650FC2C|nr:DUF2946 domain-containing protein [Caballeronia sp. SEWSISQ10-4 2]MDN7183294.1 DUF2946 domain-containing protein [Caballeronia sp. SEWSISQ10-4 2]
MFSRFHRKIGSILGLLAILMATLAPTVSQALAASRRANTVSSAHCSMPSMRDHVSDIKSGPHSLMSDGQACCYCGLLSHMPVVPSVQAPFAITVRVIAHRVTARLESVRRIEPLTYSQPRAPPVSS